MWLQLEIEEWKSANQIGYIWWMFQNMNRMQGLIHSSFTKHELRCCKEIAKKIAKMLSGGFRVQMKESSDNFSVKNAQKVYL